jgi:hypothetical protein
MMTDETTLLPSLRIIHERLTRNQRERRRLRTLLKLAIEVADDAQHAAAFDRQAAAASRPPLGQGGPS